MADTQIKNLLAYARPAFDQLIPHHAGNEAKTNRFLQKSRINELMKDPEFEFGDVFMALSHALNIALNTLDRNVGLPEDVSGIPLSLEVPEYGLAGSILNGVIINSPPASVKALDALLKDGKVEERVRRALDGVTKTTKTHKLAVMIAAIKVVEQLAVEVRDAAQASITPTVEDK